MFLSKILCVSKAALTLSVQKKKKIIKPISEFQIKIYFFNTISGYGTPTSSASETSRDFSRSPSYRNAAVSGTAYHKAREERAKWGDRGVTIGHFYDPSIKEHSKGGPEWLERGLHDTRDSGDESVKYVCSLNLIRINRFYQISALTHLFVVKTHL